MNNEFHSNSRSGYRAKRKKTNVILNSLIGIVLLLIIFVAYTIFSAPGSNKAASKQENQVTAKKTSTKKDKTTNEAAAADNNQSSDNSNQANQQNQGDQNNQTNQDNAAANSPDQSQAVVTNGSSSDPNVGKTIENPAWKPVGTTQTGQHTTKYDESSVDWQEMLNAITYATGLEQSNMIVQFLGRDRSTTDGSVGTVYSKDKQQKYRVYIKWVDGQGWEPTKVEELK